MRALLNFMQRNGWHISLLAEDAKTPIGRKLVVKDGEAVMRIIEKLHGDEAKARTALYNWGQGSVWVDLSEEQCKFFGIVWKDGHQ